jgi:hypothetical protein
VPTNVLYNWYGELNKWLPSESQGEDSPDQEEDSLTDEPLSIGRRLVVESRTDSVREVQRWAELEGSVLILSFDTFKSCVLSKEDNGDSREGQQVAVAEDDDDDGSMDKEEAEKVIGGYAHNGAMRGGLVGVGRAARREEDGREKWVIHLTMHEACHLQKKLTSGRQLRICTTDFILSYIQCYCTWALA